VSTIAVLKGGSSLERQVSLRSGARVEDALERLGHDVVAIDAGPDLIERLRAAGPDACFVVLHGRDGEDGTVQELLEILGIPYTGSGVLACMRSIDKVLAKHLLLEAGIPTPDFFSFSETAFKRLGAAEVLPAIERLAARGAALWVPVVLHWGWEADRGLADLRALATALAGLATPWESFLAAAEASR
jgi:D-alanine-D-alanine ligase